MIPGGRATFFVAYFVLASCTSTPPKITMRTDSFRVEMDEDGRAFAVTCDGTDAGNACPIQIDHGDQRQVFSLPVGERVTIAARKGTRICVANDATQATGCPDIPPPPVPPAPPPPRLS